MIQLTQIEQDSKTKIQGLKACKGGLEGWYIVSMKTCEMRDTREYHFVQKFST